MRAFLIRGGIAAAILALFWLSSARWWSLLVERVATVRLATLPSNPIGLDGGNLQFGMGEAGRLGPAGWNGPELTSGGHLAGLAGPDDTPAAALATDDANRLVLTRDGKSIVLGVRAGAMTGADGDIPAFALEPGDESSITLERSVLSWPVFETNFMTGNSPTWRRLFYYRLTLRKASGARLEMLWRFEQGYDPQNLWRAAETRPGITGLVRVDIR
jgi:hypothetical protein